MIFELFEFKNQFFNRKVLPEEFWKLSELIRDPQLIYGFIYHFSMKMTGTYL